jgi:hypothetical protein
MDTHATRRRPRVSPARSRALTTSDPWTGELVRETPAVTLRAIVAAGLASREKPTDRVYLTPEGRALRAVLTAPEITESPLPASVTPFRAD